MNAERNGYDAFIIGCYLDTGLQRARSLVDIPALGVTETSMLVACTLGRKFSMATNPTLPESIPVYAKNCLPYRWDACELRKVRVSSECDPKAPCHVKQAGNPVI